MEQQPQLVEVTGHLCGNILSIETPFVHEGRRQVIDVPVRVLNDVVHLGIPWGFTWGFKAIGSGKLLPLEIHAFDLIDLIACCIRNETTDHEQKAEDAEIARRKAEATARRPNAAFYAKMAAKKTRKAKLAAERTRLNACYVSNLKSWWTDLVNEHGVRLMS